MTVNEAKFVDMIVNHENKIEAVQKYIDENFNINSEYDIDSNTIHLWASDIHESLQLINAKNFILSNFEDNHLINVKFRKKEDN